MRLSIAAVVCLPGVAWAHHVMDRQLPGTLAEGLLSGLGHPILGLDHFAFLVGAGLVLAVVSGGAWGIAALVGGSMIGVALHLHGITLPGTEIVIAGSIFLLVLCLVAGRQWRLGALLPAFAIAGLFHGHAFAESISGAGAPALAGYVAGLIAMQAALATAAFLLRRRLLLGH